MKKTFCDRCGKEIKHRTIATEISIVWLKITISEMIPWGANIEEEVDLCEECHAAVYNFIFNNKEELTE